MKWNNRGHEFDTYVDVFFDKQILIYGAGLCGIEFLQREHIIDDCFQGFIDRDNNKKTVCGKDVINPNIISVDSTNIVIICIYDDGESNNIAKSLEEKGYIRNINFFTYKEWDSFYRYIYIFINKHMVIAPFISMQFSTICNLKCRGCVACNPQVKKPSIFDDEINQDNIEALFSNFDYIDRLDVCGGEPFVNDAMISVLEFLLPYRKRIKKLSTVTNGTFIPSDELCIELAKLDVVVKIDDYSESISQITYVSAIKEKFERYSVKYEINKVEYWIDLGIEKNQRKSNQQALSLFENCANERKSIHKGKLFCCDYAGYADSAEVIHGEKDDYLDLSQNKYMKAELLEFILGFTTNGCSEACHYCNGGCSICNVHIPVAEQLDGGKINDKYTKTT